MTLGDYCRLLAFHSVNVLNRFFWAAVKPLLWLVVDFLTSLWRCRKGRPRLHAGAAPEDAVYEWWLHERGEDSWMFLWISLMSFVDAVCLITRVMNEFCFPKFIHHKPFFWLCKLAKCKAYHSGDYANGNAKGSTSQCIPLEYDDSLFRQFECSEPNFRNQTTTEFL